MTSNGPPVADARLSVFYDPLEGWANDDLLLTPEARGRVADIHPGALRVLDWPALRALFESHDAPANTKGRTDRRVGFISVVASTLGLVLTAFATLAEGHEQLVGVSATVLTVGGAGLAFYHLLVAGTKSRWLGHRYWTERARSLYFQVLINNLDLAARAMTEDAALQAWTALRDASLKALPPPEELPSIIRRLSDDVVEADLWILREWRTPSTAPTPTPELEILFDRLRAQRFDIQSSYSGRKLSDSMRAPLRAAPALRLGSDLLTLAAIGAAAAAGLHLAGGWELSDVPVQLATALAATASALVLALRAIHDGLFLSGDFERYAWYNAAISHARARFDLGDAAAKVSALRDMEALAYRELREFIVGHRRARYVM